MKHCKKCKTELTYNEERFSDGLCQRCYEDKYPEDSEG